MIEVIVNNHELFGIESQFTIHGTLLLARSKYFQEMIESSSYLEENQVKDRNHVLHLPNECPENFRRYLNLLYANQIATKGPDEWVKICQLYVLVVKLRDLVAMNVVIDGMHAFLRDVISARPSAADAEMMLPAQAIRCLYNGTSTGSQARRLIIDMYADCGQEDWLRFGRHHLPVEFVHDVATRLMSQRPSKSYEFLASRPSILYHELDVPKRTTDHMFTPSSPRAYEMKILGSAKNMKTAKRFFTKPEPGLMTPVHRSHLPVTPPSSGGKMSPMADNMSETTTESTEKGHTTLTMKQPEGKICTHDLQMAVPTDGPFEAVELAGFGPPCNSRSTDNLICTPASAATAADPPGSITAETAKWAGTATPDTGRIATMVEKLSLQAVTPIKEPIRTPRLSIFAVDWKID